MQEKPDKLELLQSLAEFLMAEIKPQITDARLSFRVLIAANLATVVANELRGEARHEEAERARLKSLLHDVTGDDLRALNVELAARLRDGRIGLEALPHLRDTLRDQLSVNNPFFDTRPEIE
jgi:hypothetical protein